MPITPELVQEVTARVYQMLLADLKVEKERWRPVSERKIGYRRDK